MSNENTPKLSYIDPSTSGSATLKTVYPCQDDEQDLRDGIVDTYPGCSQIPIIRIKIQDQILELEMPAEDFKGLPLSEVTSFMNNLRLQSLLLHSRKLISPIAKEPAPEHDLSNLTESDYIEFTIFQRDGTKKIVTATKYNIDMVLNELKFEEENTSKLGAYCDNMEISLAFKREVNTPKGLSSLTNKIYKMEKYLHDINTKKIAEGKLSLSQYRKNFN